MILTLKWEDSDTILLRLKINQYRHDGGKIIPFRFLLHQERIFMILRWIIFSGWTGSLTKHVRLPATFCHAPLTFYWKPQVTCTAQRSSGAPHWQVKVDGVGRFFIPLCSLCLSLWAAQGAGHLCSCHLGLDPALTPTWIRFSQNIAVKWGGSYFTFYECFCVVWWGSLNDKTFRTQR